MPELTLADYRLRVSYAMGWDNTASSTEQTLIDAFVNEGVVKYLAETKAYVDSADVDLTADVLDYDIDEDILALKDVYASTDPHNPLERISIMEMETRRRFGGEDSLRWYAFEGDKLFMIWGAPADGDMLTVYYVPAPATMAATTDTPSHVPIVDQPLIAEYAKWQVAMTDQNKASELGQTFKANWDEGLVKARMRINRKDGLMMPRVRPGRLSRFPKTPGQDIR